MATIGESSTSASDPRARSAAGMGARALDRAMTTILVVDDEYSMVEALEGLLTEEGYRVLTASNGEEALELLALSKRPDLVLLDVMMPKLDGYETLRRMKEHPSWQAIPVILMSAAAQPRDPRRIGSQAFLGKPFNVVELFDLIEANAARREAELLSGV